MNEWFPVLVIVLASFGLFMLVRIFDRFIATRTDATAESSYTIDLSYPDLVSGIRPDGQIEQVRWDELEKVELLGTTDGPLLPDMFWVLHGKDSGCIIPWGATGDGDLLERLQGLPGFDNGAVLRSAPKTSESIVTCWTRS